MKPDVSVIMPALNAHETIAEAASSVLSGQGVAVELVVCSDDGSDYRALLRDAGLPVQNITHCSTATPQSGPSTARNIALEAARAPVVAALDADDAYVRGRLRKILDAMMGEGVGVGTGPTIEQTRDGAPQRIAATVGSRLPLATICGVRMPFSPVFERSLAPDGWPPVSFAEDMVLNAHLWAEAGGYAFADRAAYRYFIGETSLVRGEGALSRAITGYHEILGWLTTCDINQAAREEIARVIGEDLCAAQCAGT